MIVNSSNGQNNTISDIPNGTKSKTVGNNTQSFIKIGDNIHPINTLLGKGGFGKVKLSGTSSVLKIEKENQSSLEYEILNDLKLSNGRVKHIDKNKYYTLMDYLGTSLHQLLSPYDLILINRRPGDSKILPHTFYIYLNSNSGEIKYVFKDEFDKIQEKTLDAKDVSEYEALKTKLKSKSLHLFSYKIAEDNFPYKLWETIPDDSDIPKDSLSLYIDQEQLVVAYKDNNDEVKGCVFDEDPFREKQNLSINFKYKICKKRPDDNMIIAENTFYLYLNKGGLRCLYKDKNKKRLVIKTDNRFYTAIQKMFDTVNLKPRIQSYSDEVLQTEIFQAAGLTLKKISKDRRMEIIIDLCLEVAYLSEGLKSTSGKGYSHLDIKPRNVVVNTNNVPRLVDFGMSRPDPNERRKVYNNKPSGTNNYLPYYIHHKNGLTKAQFDMIALKRVIFLPLSFYSKTGKKNISNHHQKTHSLLSKKILDEYQLTSFVDTSEITQCEDTMSARTLAAIFIIAKLGLPFEWYQKLVGNKDLCKKITEAYAKNSLKQHIVNIFNDSITLAYPGSELPTQDAIDLNLKISQARNQINELQNNNYIQSVQVNQLTESLNQANTNLLNCEIQKNSAETLQKQEHILNLDLQEKIKRLEEANQNIQRENETLQENNATLQRENEAHIQFFKIHSTLELSEINKLIDNINITLEKDKEGGFFTHSSINKINEFENLKQSLKEAAGKKITYKAIIEEWEQKKTYKNCDGIVTCATMMNDHRFFLSYLFAPITREKSNTELFISQLKQVVGNKCIINSAEERPENLLINTI